MADKVVFGKPVVDSLHSDSIGPNSYNEKLQLTGRDDKSSEDNLTDSMPAFIIKPFEPSIEHV